MSAAAIYPSESAPGHPDYTDTVLLGSVVRVALQALSRTLHRDERDRTPVSVARIEEYRNSSKAP